MKFRPNSNKPYRELRYMWKDDPEFIKQRKKEWKRISKAFSDYDRDNVRALRDFCVTGDDSNIPSGCYNRFVLTPWSTREELKQLLNALVNSDDGNSAGLFVRREPVGEDAREQDKDLLLDSNKIAILDDVLTQAEYDIDRGIKIESLWFEFDFFNFPAIFERALYKYLRGENRLWLYSEKTSLNLYNESIRLIESQNKKVEHHDFLKKLIVLVFNYSPVHLFESNRKTARKMASLYKDWIGSRDSMLDYISFRNSAEKSMLKEVKRTDEVRTEKNGITHFKKDQGYPPYFIFDKDVTQVLPVLYDALLEGSVTTEVVIEVGRTVSLHEEIEAEFAESAGLFENGVVPALHIPIKPSLSFRGEGEGESEEKSIWFDLYAFSSEQKIQTEIGVVTGYIVPRLTEHFRDYYLNVPLLQFRDCVKSAFTLACGRRAAVPMPIDKERDELINYKFPSLSLRSRPSMLDWNINGAASHALDVVDENFHERLSNCLKYR